MYTHKYTYRYVWPCQRLAVGSMNTACMHARFIYRYAIFTYTHTYIRTDMFGPANASQLEQLELHIFICKICI